MCIFLFIYWPFKCSTIQNTSVKSSDLCFAYIRFAIRRLQLRLKQQFAAFIEWLQLLLVCLLLILVLLLFPLLMLLLLMLLFLLNGGQFKARNWRWPCQIALVIVAVRLPVWLSARLSVFSSFSLSTCLLLLFIGFVIVSARARKHELQISSTHQWYLVIGIQFALSIRHGVHKLTFLDLRGRQLEGRAGQGTRAMRRRGEERGVGAAIWLSSFGVFAVPPASGLWPAAATLGKFANKYM